MVTDIPDRYAEEWTTSECERSARYESIMNSLNKKHKTVKTEILQRRCFRVEHVCNK